VDDRFVMEVYEKSELYRKYDEYFDRESAFEILSARIKAQEDEALLQKQAKEEEKLLKEREKELEKMQKQRQKQVSSLTRSARTFSNSILRSIGYRIGRDIYGMIKGDGKKKDQR